MDIPHGAAPSSGPAPSALTPLSATSGTSAAESARALHILSQCNRTLFRIDDEKALLAEVCRIAVDAGGYRMAWVGGAGRPEEPRLEPLAFAGHEAGFLATLAASWADLPLGTPGPLGDALRLLAPATCADLAGDAAATERGYRSLLALPLVHGGKVLGVLALYGAQAAAATAAELALLQGVADNLAFAWGGIRARRARSQLEASVFKAVGGLSGPSGLLFFESMVRKLTEATNCQVAVLTRVLPQAPGERQRARVVAGLIEGQAVEPLSFELDDTPCRQLLSAPSVLQAGPLRSLYPHAQLLQHLDPQVYMGHRLEDSSGQLLGMLFIAYKATPDEAPLLRAALQVFAARASAELECVEAYQEIRRLNASLEERVHQRTAELKLANEELESFCYSVSHDLRSPLSAVDGFSSLLEQALASSAEPVAERNRHYLRRIRAGMVQMGELIDALLQLARLARAPMTLVQVDLSAMAREILGIYQEQDAGRALESEVEPGLVVIGDARLLRRLMDNLLGNAWKFSAGKAVTRIRFARAPAPLGGAGGETALPVFVVEDEGAGFNMAYAQKLFGPFQRLHSPSEFEGSGIGLATVQRIVNRHAGRVWGEAELGKGARFYFSLGGQPPKTAS